MSFIVRESGGGGDFSPHPSGVFPARCTRIVDLGTQDEDFQGQKKQIRKVVFFFETDQLMEEGEMAGKPYLINKEYTVSLGEKATLRKDLESWRGRKFTKEELDGFGIENVLNKPLMLNIVDYKKANGKDSTKIGSMMPLPKGMVANPAVGDVFYFCLYDDNFNIKPLDKVNFEKVSKFWQGKIAKSAEYATAVGGSTKASSDSYGEDEDDDIPF